MEGDPEEEEEDLTPATPATPAPGPSRKRSADDDGGVDTPKRPKKWLGSVQEGPCSHRL